VEDINMTTDALYFKIKMTPDVDPKKRFMFIKHGGQQILDFNLAEPLPYSDFCWGHFGEVKLSGKLDFFKGTITHISRVGTEMKTCCHVIHGNFQSVYDLDHEKWIKHVLYDDEVVDIMKMKNFEGEEKICVLLKNGDVFMDTTRFDH
jgi:hypothetical protein